MKVTDLKDWKKLTPKEQERLRQVYEVDENDNLPDTITKTVADKENSQANKETNG